MVQQALRHNDGNGMPQLRRRQKELSGKVKKVEASTQNLPDNGPTIELVVCRFKEDVSWVSRLLARMPPTLTASIMNHGQRLPDRLNATGRLRDWPLPNRGRECDCYLQHIIATHPHFASRTIYAQADACCTTALIDHVHEQQRHLPFVYLTDKLWRQLNLVDNRYPGYTDRSCQLQGLFGIECTRTPKGLVLEGPGLASFAVSRPRLLQHNVSRWQAAADQLKAWSFTTKPTIHHRPGLDDRVSVTEWADEWFGCLPFERLWHVLLGEPLNLPSALALPHHASERCNRSGTARAQVCPSEASASEAGSEVPLYFVSSRQPGRSGGAQASLLDQFKLTAQLDARIVLRERLLEIDRDSGQFQSAGWKVAIRERLKLWLAAAATGASTGELVVCSDIDVRFYTPDWTHDVLACLQDGADLCFTKGGRTSLPHGGFTSINGGFFAMRASRTTKRFWKRVIAEIDALSPYDKGASMLEQTVINRMIKANDTEGAVLKFYSTSVVRAGQLEGVDCLHLLRVHHCAGCGDSDQKLATLERVARTAVSARPMGRSASCAEEEEEAGRFVSIDAFSSRGQASTHGRRLLEVPSSPLVVPRVVWLYWDAGWDPMRAPYLVQCVAASWRHHNPRWQVILLSHDNVSRFVRLPAATHGWPLPARSDVLRIALLATYGGVWADATMLCTQPLDDWVDTSARAEGMWMYHRVRESTGINGMRRAPASWFLVANNGSWILNQWAHAVDVYVARHQQPHAYFWLDDLFDKLIDSSMAFREAWRRVPSLDCNSRGSAHSMGEGRGIKVLEARRACLIAGRLPYALKLDKRVIDPLGTLMSGSEVRNKHAGLQNAHYAILRSLGTLRCAAGQPVATGPMSDWPWPRSTCIAVLSDYNRSGSVRLAARLASRHGCRVHVMSKSPSGCSGYRELQCTAMTNVGRDAGAALDYVSRNYDSLDDIVVFSGSSLRKHDRMKRFVELLKGAAALARGLAVSPGTGPSDTEDCTAAPHRLADFDCASVPPIFGPRTFGSVGVRLSTLANFTIKRWGRSTLLGATPSPFGPWMSTHVGEWHAHVDNTACYNVVWRSTRSLLQRRPRHFYENLARQVNQADGTEAVHFVERGLGSIFGDGYRPDRHRQPAARCNNPPAPMDNGSIMQLRLYHAVEAIRQVEDTCHHQPVHASPYGRQPIRHTHRHRHAWRSQDS